jgi:hypothetical protein
MICELCGRDVSRVTSHHLIPKATHTKRLKRELGEERNVQADLCVACHRQLHYLFENKILGRELNTLDVIRRNEDVITYVKWIRKRPGDFTPRKGVRRN